MAGGNKSSTKRQVLFLIDKLAGGTGRVFTDLIRSLDRAVYGIHLVPLAEGGGLLREVPGDVALHSVLRENEGWRLGRFRAWGRLHNLIRESKIDLVVSTLEISNVFAAALKRWNPSLKVILCYHTNFSAFRSASHKRFTFFGLPMEWFIRRTYPWADAVVSPSRGAAEDLVKTFGLPQEKSRWIHNPVDTARIERLASEPASLPWKDRSVPILSAVGMHLLVDHKGFDILIRAVAEFHGKAAPRLVLMGSGPQEEKVKELAATLGVADRVWFGGFDTNPWKFVAQTDLFVLPSRWETFGLVIVEAMCCGVPVLAADCPYGPSEIIRHGRNGWLIPPDDPRSMADAIRTLLRKKTLLNMLGRNGHRRAQDFSLYRRVSEYEKLFRQVLSS